MALETSKAAADEDKQRARQIEIDDFRWLMKQKQGRRFIWRLLERCGNYRTSFRVNNEMAFLEGQRNIGLILIGEIHEICPEQYPLMIKEQQEYGGRNTDRRGSNSNN